MRTIAMNQAAGHPRQQHDAGEVELMVAGEPGPWIGRRQVGRTWRRCDVRPVRQGAQARLPGSARFNSLATDGGLSRKDKR